MADGQPQTGGGFSFVDALLTALPLATAASPLIFGPKVIPGANLAIQSFYAANQARRIALGRKAAADKIAKQEAEGAARSQAFGLFGLPPSTVTAFTASSPARQDEQLLRLGEEAEAFSELPFLPSGPPPQPVGQTQLSSIPATPAAPSFDSPPTPRLSPQQIFNELSTPQGVADTLATLSSPQIAEQTTDFQAPTPLPLRSRPAPIPFQRPQPRVPARDSQDGLVTQAQFDNLPIHEKRKYQTLRRQQREIDLAVETKRRLFPVQLQHQAEQQASSITQVIFGDPSADAEKLAAALASVPSPETPGYRENLQELVPLVQQMAAQDAQMRNATGIFGRDAGSVGSSSRVLERHAQVFRGRHGRIPFGFDPATPLGQDGFISPDQIQEFVNAAHTLPAYAPSQAMFTAFVVNPRLAVESANYAATLDPHQDFETIGAIMSSLSSYAESVTTGTVEARLGQAMEAAGSDQQRDYLMIVAEQRLLNSPAHDAQGNAAQIRGIAAQMRATQKAKAQTVSVEFGGSGDVEIVAPQQRKGMDLYNAARTLHDGIDLLQDNIAQHGVDALSGPVKVIRQFFAWTTDQSAIAFGTAEELAPVQGESTEDYMTRAYGFAHDPAIGELNAARSLMVFAIARTIDPSGQISEAARDDARLMVSDGGFFANPLQSVAALRTFRDFANKRTLAAQVMIRGVATKVLPKALREQALVNIAASPVKPNKREIEILLIQLSRNPEFNVDVLVPSQEEIISLMKDAGLQ